jgi:hypothetical protein
MKMIIDHRMDQSVIFLCNKAHDMGNRKDLQAKNRQGIKKSEYLTKLIRPDLIGFVN